MTSVKVSVTAGKIRSLLAVICADCKYFLMRENETKFCKGEENNSKGKTNPKNRLNSRFFFSF